METKEITVGEWLKNGVKLGFEFISLATGFRYKVVELLPELGQIKAVLISTGLTATIPIMFFEKNGIIPIIPHG